MRFFVALLLAVIFASMTYGQLNNRLDKLDVNDLNAKKLTVQSTTSASKPCPAMTEVQRNALGSLLEGQCVFNTTTKTLNIYDSSSWVEAGAGGISNWETAKNYEVGDVVIESTKIYQANTAHLSTVFASQIANWTLISGVVLNEATGSLDASMIGSGTVSNTEFGYLNNASSEIQSQINGKQATITGAATSITSSDLSASKAVVSDASGKISASSITSTEIDSLSGISSNIQTQLNAKEPSITTLPLNKGGTNKSLTAAAGGVAYSDADSLELTGAGTSGQVLTSNGAGAPTWQNAPGGEVSDATFSGVLSLGKGGTSKSLTANNGAIPYSDADSLELLAPGTSGQILQSNGAGAPTFVNKSVSAKAENASAVTLEEVQVSNNQLTQTASNKHLIESGNKNILVNPSFEHSTFSTGWTNSAGTFTEETALEIHGLKAAKLVLSSQAMALTQDSTLYASQFADGVQGLVSVMIKSDVALKVCSRSAGVTSTSNCLDVQANNKWASYKLPTVLGATSQGISIASTGAVSGTVYIDDAFVGASDLVSTYGEAKLAGEAYFAGTSGCIWDRSSTTVGPFGAVAACPGPTISYQSLGQWQTTDSNLPKVTINNLPSGVYKAIFHVAASYTSTAAYTAYAINDGVTTCEPVSANNDQIYPTGVTLSCIFTYNSSGNRSFELYGGSDANALYISNNRTAPRISTKFILEYYGSNSTYTTLNADTDWAACNFSTLAWNGLGTVTHDLKCKRQGGDLIISGRYTVGTVSGVEARIPLPLWNGVQLISASSQRIPSTQSAGRMLRNVATVQSDQVAIIDPSQSYIRIAFANDGANSPLTVRNGDSVFQSGNLAIVESIRIPIEGWQNSNIIIGQFNGLEKCTDSYECTDVFSAKVSAAGVVSDENIDWINGNCSGSNPISCTFKLAVFTVSPNCTAVVDGASSATSARVNSITSSGFSVDTYSGSTAILSGFRIICQKQGVDYIGKTAKAVASDQNVATPGVTKAVMYSSTIANNGTVSKEIGDMINGNCTNADPMVCTLNSVFTGSSYNCTASSVSVANGFCNVTSYGSSSFSIRCFDHANGIQTTVASKTILCHGVAP